MTSKTPNPSSAEHISCRYQAAVGSTDSSTLAAPGLNDSAWKVGGRAGAPEGIGAVWFRCQVKVPEKGAEHGLVLDLGRVADVDRTFVNGVEVGNTQMVPSLEWQFFHQRTYFVRPDVLGPPGSEALVSVRASSRSFGTVGFVDHGPRFQRSWNAAGANLYEFLPFGFVIVFLALVRLYPFNREVSRLRLRSLTQMGLGISAVVLLNTFLLYRIAFPLSNVWLRFHVATTAVSAWLLFRFLDGVLGRKVDRWLAAWTFAVVAIAAALPGYTNESWSTTRIAQLFGVWGLPIIAQGAWMVTQVGRRFFAERSPALLSLLTGGMLLMLLGGWDIYELLNGRLPVSMPASGIGFMCFFIGAIFNAIALDREGVVEEVRSEYAAHAAVASLASQVAHDIRSPLAALEMVVDDLDSLPEEKRILVREAAQRIKDIANNLLSRNRAVTRGEDEEAAAEKIGLDHLPGVVEQIVSEKRAQFRARQGLHIETRAGQSAYGLFANVDSSILKRMLSNLINNSVEAIDVRGRVRVRVQEREGRVEISVEDDGKGIPEEVVARLGQKGETHDKQGGSGLGLFHARESAERWGGSLQIHSKIGQGTSITLSLPRQQAPKWFLTELRLETGQTVVILDDDQSIHEIWARRLPAGINLVHLHGGEEFARWVRAQEGGVEARGARFREPPLYLVDFELKGERLSGLDWIEEFDLQARSVMVSSRFEDAAIRARCEEQGIRMVPKGLAGFVPVRVSRADDTMARPDCVLIDDDLLVHLIWKSAADKRGRTLLAFAGADEFEAQMARIARDTPIYIDSDLGDGVRGEEVSRRYFEAGFRTIYLATGSQTSDFELGSIPWIVQIVGKSPPQELRDAQAQSSGASGLVTRSAPSSTRDVGASP